MPIDLLMPQLSPTMTEGRLTSWLKKEGDKISAGDVIAEVETDKATMEVEATDDGILHQIIGKAGDDIQVGVPIAILAEEGEDVKSDYKPTSKVVEKPAETAVPAAAPAPVAMPAPAAPVAAASAPTPAAASGGARVKASPLAKRLAQKMGVALGSIMGSGPHGRIIKKDVQTGQRGSVGNTPIVRHADTSEKVAPMRKAIAARLTAAKQHVPHFYLTADVEMDAVLEARAQINDYTNVKLTVNDFIIKACANALANNPQANAAWANDSVVTYGNVDMSVAVSIEGGLITPIVQNADQKSLMQISTEIKELATAARANSLKPEQYEGGSFTVSNLGMYGVKEFSAIINSPQAAILACGAAKAQVLADPDSGEFYAASVMSITMSVDHRVIDGALGAELLADIKAYLENPITMLV